jgi:hypothetical protein
MKKLHKYLISIASLLLVLIFLGISDVNKTSKKEQVFDLTITPETRESQALGKLTDLNIMEPSEECTNETDPYFKILTPNGGEVYSSSRELLVTWESCNISKDSRIAIGLNYLHEEHSAGYGEGVMVDFPLNTGSYTFNLSPEDILNPIIEPLHPVKFGRNFKVNIGTVPQTFPSYHDVSDDVFTIESNLWQLPYGEIIGGGFIDEGIAVYKSNNGYRIINQVSGVDVEVLGLPDDLEYYNFLVLPNSIFVMYDQLLFSVDLETGQIKDQKSIFTDERYVDFWFDFDFFPIKFSKNERYVAMHGGLRIDETGDTGAVGILDLATGEIHVLDVGYVKDLEIGIAGFIDEDLFLGHRKIYDEKLNYSANIEVFDVEGNTVKKLIDNYMFDGSDNYVNEGPDSVSFIKFKVVKEDWWKHSETKPDEFYLNKKTLEVRKAPSD